MGQAIVAFFISGHMLSMWNFQAHMFSMSNMWEKTIGPSVHLRAWLAPLRAV